MNTKSSNLLIVGLGNIGNEYERTRHNAGFMAADYLAGELAWKKEKNYLFAKTDAIIFIKPTTFMNLSGSAVLAAATKYKIPLENITIIHDDIDLTTGDIRTKVGGGNAGHNGLKSIDAAMGRDYRRIRIGVGRPENPMIDIADWVLGKFSATEMKVIKEVIEKKIPLMIIPKKI